MVSLLKVKILVLTFLLTLALGLSSTAKASQFGIATFTYGVLWGSVEFPDEVHPLDFVTCNLTIGAYDDVNIYNLTLQISALGGQDWVALGTQQLTMYSLAQDMNLTRQVAFTLPQSTSGKLRYIIEASTDRGFGNTAFYATSVHTITYEELTNTYNALLSNHTTLQTSYNQLLTNYTAIDQVLNTLQTDYNTTRTAYNLLDSNYQSLNTNYTSLKSNYDSLHDQSTYLEEKYDATIGELTIVRYLMYALGLTTAILAATTVYFRKKAPYIVLRKENTPKSRSE
jgi:hypothetical protein